MLPKKSKAPGTMIYLPNYNKQEKIRSRKMAAHLYRDLENKGLQCVLQTTTPTFETGWGEELC